MLVDDKEGHTIKVNSQLGLRNFFLFYGLCRLDLRGFDFVHCVDRFGLMALADSHIDTGTRVSMGIYHSKEMFWDTKRGFATQQTQVFNNLFGSGKSVYFGNKTVAEMYTEKFGESFCGDCVFPLGVKMLGKKEIAKSFKYRMAIIGRHTSFKAYISEFLSVWNTGQLDFLQPLEVVLIGEGPETERLRAEFPNAKLLGSLDRKQLATILNDVDFVLCGGTTAPLVASSGTPVIVGIENYNLPKTPGFFHMNADRAYNIYDPNCPMYDFSTILREFYSSEKNIAEIGRKDREASFPYDISVTITKMESFLENSRPFKKYVSRQEIFKYRLSLLKALVKEFLGLSSEIRQRYR